MDEWELFLSGSMSMAQIEAFEKLNMQTRTLYAPTVQSPPGIVRFFFFTPNAHISFEADYGQYETAHASISAHAREKHFDFEKSLLVSYDTWRALRESKIHTQRIQANLAIWEFCLGLEKIRQDEWRALNRVSVFCAEMVDHRIKTMFLSNTRTHPFQVITLQ